MEITGIMDLSLKGYCCSQIIMELGLTGLGKRNPDLIQSMEGLCKGVQHGHVCGILSAAICLIYLADKAKAQAMSNDLWDWFLESFNNTECDALVGELENAADLCFEMMESTYLKIIELFEQNDVCFENE
jgi:hypothetical protein